MKSFRDYQYAEPRELVRRAEILEYKAYGGKTCEAVSLQYRNSVDHLMSQAFILRKQADVMETSLKIPGRAYRFITALQQMMLIF
ncbi:MAG: hypothetical protein AABW73_02745 [Nanoarchaeota archaeon]